MLMEIFALKRYRLAAIRCNYGSHGQRKMSRALWTRCGLKTRLSSNGALRLNRVTSLLMVPRLHGKLFRRQIQTVTELMALKFDTRVLMNVVLLVVTVQTPVLLTVYTTSRAGVIKM
jgi:hypothetical protein